MFNNKTGSIRKEFFYSVDEANLECTLKTLKMQLVLRMAWIFYYTSIKVFVLSISGYGQKDSYFMIVSEFLAEVAVSI